MPTCHTTLNTAYISQHRTIQLNISMIKLEDAIHRSGNTAPDPYTLHCHLYKHLGNRGKQTLLCALNNACQSNLPRLLVLFTYHPNTNSPKGYQRYRLYNGYPRSGTAGQVVLNFFLLARGKLPFVTPPVCQKQVKFSIFIWE